MTNAQDTAVRVNRRAEMEAVLADYPHVSDDSLAALLRWFRKEASAFDVATVASNPAVAEPYRRFRAEHLDPITAGEWLKGLIIAGLVALAVVLIIWRAF